MTKLGKILWGGPNRHFGGGPNSHSLWISWMDIQDIHIHIHFRAYTQQPQFASNAYEIVPP